MSTEEAKVELIECEICHAQCHAIELHLKKDHAEIKLEIYQQMHPGAPIYSPLALEKIQAHKLKTNMAGKPAVATVIPIGGVVKSNVFHEVFDLPPVKETGNGQGTLNGKGNPIPCTVFDVTGEFSNMIPDLDNDFVFEVESLKNCVMALELNMPLFLFGHAGTGKSTLPEQIAARTGRPWLRIQHTIGMEERDVIGQWVVRGGQTLFQLGPLPLAMINGWTYLADEYDRAPPGVLSLYQAVLEGKSLVIKEADPEHRVIRPHKNFRIIGNGNTNGVGDESGLYQGTMIQDAANFDRFQVMVQMKYMKPELEIKMLMGKADIGKTDADKMVDFATKVREAYTGGKISNTISPRTLIAAAKLGIRKGKWTQGITLAFTNKLSAVDREVVDQLAQRVFAS